MEDPKIAEIKRSLDSYVQTFGIEGAETEIKIVHENNEKLRDTMLFLLYDKFNFGKKR